MEFRLQYKRVIKFTAWITEWGYCFNYLNLCGWHQMKLKAIIKRDNATKFDRKWTQVTSIILHDENMRSGGEKF